MHTFQYHVTLEENMKQTSMKQRESFHNYKHIRQMCVSNTEARARGPFPRESHATQTWRQLAATHSPVDYKESTLTLGLMGGTP